MPVLGHSCGCEARYRPAFFCPHCPANMADIMHPNGARAVAGLPPRALRGGCANTWPRISRKNISIQGLARIVGLFDVSLSPARSSSRKG